MDSVIQVKNLCFSYNDYEFINKMSFEIKRNTYTCIVGANGSGKTTLLKLISGLLEAKKGEILIDGELLNSENMDGLRKKIGVIFQNPDNQYVGTTLKDDIIFGLENHNVDPNKMDEIVDEISELCGVKDLLNKEPHTMSGGQKQKGAIAGVLAIGPEILILDEATSMLDPASKKEFKENIMRLKKERDLTIISITHDKNETLNADKVIVLDKGSIVFDGASKDFYNIDVGKYNLELPYLIQLEKILACKEYVEDEQLFFEMLEGEVNENRI